MKRIFMTVCFLMLLIPFEAEAESLWIEVTPENIKDQNLIFDVKSRQLVSEKHVDYFITVRKGKVDFIPFYGATLTVKKDDKELVVRCQVDGKKEKDCVTYIFSISREYLTESTFAFADYAHSQGKPMPSADFYSFKLKLFAEEKDASEQGASGGNK